MPDAHDQLLVDTFGPHARAYVESAAHATGWDLERLAALAAARPGSRILDLGCGGGHASFAVAPYAEAVVAYDLSQEMLDAVGAEAARRGLAAIGVAQGSVATLPFEDASFDLVLTRYSAHHWRDLPAALRQVRRVVKDGGRVVVVDTVAPEAPALDDFLHRVECLRDPSHVRNRTVAAWRRALGEAGLDPAPAQLSRLRLDFATWIARIGTKEPEVSAIRALQAQAPAAIAAHFAIEPDGSFAIDTMLVEAAA